MEKQTHEKLIRPVKCHICNEQMFYSGDKKHEPEIRVTVESGDEINVFYVHVRCWNKRIKEQQ